MNYKISFKEMDKLAQKEPKKRARVFPEAKCEKQVALVKKLECFKREETAKYQVITAIKTTIREQFQFRLTHHF